MKKYFIISLLFLAGCSSVQETILPKSESANGQKALDDLYNKGKSERLAGNPNECLKTFGKLIDLRKSVQDSLLAYSLYQSGLCHEMKTEYDRAIAVYQDALRVKAVVNSELALLEIPSRLAIAYERIGDPSTANNYYQLVKKYVDGLKKDKRIINSKKEYYAETLFQMGTIANNYMPLKTDDKNILATDFVSYLKSVRYSQEYLMLVLELDVDPYAEYAFKQMINNFQSTFNYINNLPLEDSGDELLAKRDRQNKQKEMCESLAHHIDDFETEAAIQKKSKRDDYKEIFAKLKEIKLGLDSIINERPIGEGLTLEAQKLKEPKIDGTFAPVKGEKE